ncbi:malonic semialdehyde reductase [Tessaracoccus sp. MC1865]|uniref:malonic semialdehyde reductase n=1 Tax=Tessaracoccus sp. MC1865 TaxID=2760310 RepID=UPI0016049F54|nr:malonic semialdehyde reductase [Tessaracoccus sp. MC1865]MBB1482768.1 malonic semialdehyde reductase [Tessaracoccus sp. MC1865]QTO37786.1 malonic semialdehyde reductase [Tessaracoccus sp. MC1865]
MTLVAPPEHITASRIFTERHTAYRFTSEPVTDDELAQVYELAKFTPTAMNSQPLRITFVRTPEAKSRLLPLLAEFNRHKSESAPVVAILAADIDFHEHLPVVSPQSAGARDRFEADDAMREAFARNNAWLQAGGFILAVRSVGLDAGPMGGVDLAGLDREFFPGTSMRSLMVVNIGHVAEDGTFPRNPRLAFDEAASLI